MPTCDGRTLRGQEVLAHGQMLAYGGLPYENVAFIGCHDNQTMFDQVRIQLTGGRAGGL